MITGFLGAGKTTLANMLLSRYAADGERTVYVVNEFGQTGVDAELVRSAGFEAIPLKGGCVCCTLKGELTATLREVVQEFKPARILFETSGLFVFDQFEDVLRDEQLRGRCRIRRAVVVIDSINYKNGGPAEGSFIANQIRNASVLVVSKLERFHGDRVEIACDLRNMNPNAAIVAQIWDDEGFIDAVLTPEGRELDVSLGHCHAHMDAVTLQVKDDMSRDTANRLIRSIVSGECGSVLRVKGFIRIAGVPHILNIAQGDAVLQQTALYRDLSLTFIGRNLKIGPVEDLISSRV